MGFHIQGRCKVSTFTGCPKSLGVWIQGVQDAGKRALSLGLKPGGLEFRAWGVFRAVSFLPFVQNWQSFSRQTSVAEYVEVRFKFTT